MKKYLKFISINYAFYKIYRFAKFIHVRIPETTASAVVTLLILLLINPLDSVLISNQNYSIARLERWQLYIIGGVFYFFVMFLYYNKKRCVAIIECYKDEGSDFKIITDIVFVILLILYFIWLFSLNQVVPKE